MSDHMLLEATLELNINFRKLKMPKPKIPFKMRQEIIDDVDFQNEIKEKIDFWNFLRFQYSYDIVEWWELMVKPGIKDIAIEYTKNRNKSNMGYLNFLFMKQLHFSKKVREGVAGAKEELFVTKLEINSFF